MQTFDRLQSPKYIPVTISDKSEVYPALKQFFGPAAGKEAQRAAT
jgi:uncharacterized protein